jgi:hypothetical protein
VLGGDASADPVRVYTLHQGAGGAQYAEFTLSQERRGQIDAVAGPLSVEGNTASVRVSFVQAVPSTSTRFTVRLPAGVSNIKIDPAPSGAPDVNAKGESLYLVSSRALSVGAKSEISVSYTQASGGTPSDSGGSSPSLIIAFLGIVLVLLVAVIVLVARFGLADRGSESDEEDEDVDEDDEDIWYDEDDEDDDIDEDEDDEDDESEDD